MTAENRRVLVVDDEKAIRRLLDLALSPQGYAVFEAASAAEGLARAIEVRPDLILLDLGLPDRDGREFIEELRSWSQIPLIVLSVRDREAEKIAALDGGANDYVVKPFGIGELLARMRAVLRRALPAGEEPLFRVGDLEVDLPRRRVLLGGRELSLTPTEYDLLKTLIRHRGKVVTHGRLLQAVWGEAYREERHLLQVNMSNLRRKIEPDPSRPRYLLTEPGVGYRLRDEG
ncbi:response regulator [Aminithiophilus ramosus]|uniref:Response regulator n=2 Tax=Synergistales TaxID=649776 RepID=A0A9Q7EVH7_9BACT|nr:response regulator [Aminithiophilus ramosus]QTX32468.1 response regulator [Aminithiophilus ramosus]QVL36345.1 response regulator [Synergistota bacterium]